MLEKLKNSSSKKSIQDITNAIYYGITGTVMSLFDTSCIKMVYQNIKDDLNFAKYKTWPPCRRRSKDKVRRSAGSSSSRQRRALRRKILSSALTSRL